jgi:hypothetical protein
MSENETAFVFAVISEAKGDQEIARGLAERVFVEKIDWLEGEDLAALCHWHGFEPRSDYLSWSAIERLAKRANLVTHGRYAGAFDERRARLALLLFNSLERQPDAVAFVRDTDNVAERVPSLERARSRPWPFSVVLATPHTKRECWVLNGFEPRDAAETEALERIRQELGFDPCLAAERLTAKGIKGKRNAKVVLEKGLGVRTGSDREDACWQETPLDVLRTRGRETLLAAYLQEIADHLVPIVAGTSGGKTE